MNAFNSIGLMGRVKNASVKETLIQLIDFLSSLPKKIYIESDTAQVIGHVDHPILSGAELGRHCDLLMVVGGDGSFLHAAHVVLNQGIPILGINRGSLGFLTDIHPSEYKKIARILEGEYFLEQRFLLTAKVFNEHQTLEQDHALNEVAIIPDAIPHMIEFEIYIDQQFVCSQHSDGLIIATPTGSTAYALSGGGPIVHPHLNAMVLVPMFPHTLSSRPIVVSSDSIIDVVISPKNKTLPRITCDGRAYISVPRDAQIQVGKKEKLLQLVHPNDYQYYETLRTKLHWGKKLHY